MLGEHTSGDRISYGDVAGNYNAIGEGAQVLVNNINHAISTIDELEKEAQVAERILAQRIKALVAQHQRSLTRDIDSDISNPYKALLNYQLADAPYFFGREQDTATLLEKFKQNPLTILHSESGSGKTSLIKAGLSAHLLKEGHLPLYLRPFRQPVQTSIKKAFLPDYENLKELERFKQMSLKGFLEQVINYLGDKRLYIFIDQFEEFFTMQSQKDRVEFAMELKDCIDSTLPIHWMLALRKEYFADLQVFKSVNPFNNEYFLKTFNIEEAEDVILKPACMYNVTYEDGLVSQIINDLKIDERVAPSQVQLVCHTLFEELRSEDDGFEIQKSLYKKERGHPGKQGQPGSKGILASHLARVLNRELNREERKVATRLFEELVSSDTRRLIVDEEDILKNKLDDLDSAVVRSVLEKLELSRLVRKELDDDQKPVYELAHDHLLTEIQLDPRTLQRKAAQELLVFETKNYHQHKTLLSEEKYNIIDSQKEFLKIDSIGLELLQRSRQEIEDIENEEIQKIQRLAEEQTKRAEAETKRAEESLIANQKLRRLAFMLTGFFIIAVLAASIAIASRNRATRSEAAAVVARQFAETREAEAKDAKEAEERAKIDALAAQKSAEESEKAEELAKINALAAQKSAEESKKETEDALEKVELEGQRSQTPALLALSEEILPEGVNPSKNEFDTAMLMAIHAYNTNKNFDSPPLSLATINEQFRELALFNAQRPVWTSQNDKGIWVNEWGGSELDSTSHIAFSADGGWAVSTKVRPGFYIWKRGNPKAQFIAEIEIDEKNSSVIHLTMSHNGSHFLTVNNFNEIDLWKIIKAEDQSILSIEKLPAPQIPEDIDISSVTSPIFSPSGELILIGTNIGRVYFWELNELDKPYFIRGHRNKEIKSLSFSPDGNLLATGGREYIYLWDLSKKTSYGRVKIDLINSFGDGEYAAALQFSPSGEILAAGGPDGNVSLWNVSNPSYPTRLNFAFLGDPGSLASSIKFSADEFKIAVGQANGSIYVWSMLSPETPRILDGNNLTTQDAFLFSDNGDFLRSIDSDDRNLRVWDLSLPEYRRLKIRGDDFGLNSMAYLENQPTLVTFGVDKNLKILDLASLKLSILRIKSNRNGSVANTTFSANGRFFARYIQNFSYDRFEVFSLANHTTPTKAGSKSLQAALAEAKAETLDSVDLLEESLIHTIEFEPESSVKEIVISPDGSLLLVGFADKPYFDLWYLNDPDQREPVKVSSQYLDADSQILGPYIFSENGNYLAVGGKDQKESGVLIWDTRDDSGQISESRFLQFDVGEEQEEWVASANALAFSHDNRLIAVSDNTPRVQIWNVEVDSKNPLYTLSTVNVEISALAFSANNQSLIFGDVRGSLRVWSLNPNRPIEVNGLPAQQGVYFTGVQSTYYLEGHRNKINSIQFSPDRTHISTISDDGFILVQPTLTTLITSACIRASRDEISTKYWEKHLPDLTYEQICGTFTRS